MKQNLKIQNQIKAYSAAAVVFVQMQNEAIAQSVYYNIDPDENLGWYADLALDVNDDGDTDIILNAYLITSWFYSYYTGSSTTTQGVYFKASSALGLVGLPGGDGIVSNLNPGDIVGASANWINGDEITFAGFSNKTYYYNTVVEGWNKQNNYIGFKFMADGSTYYGWVRLSLDNLSNDITVLPKLIVQDYAYSETPDSPITIQNPTASIPENLQLYDTGETSTADDLQLSFKKAANESTVNEYRIYLHKIPDILITNLTALLDLPSERYISIMPDGNDHVIQFNASTLDTDGETIVLDQNYATSIIAMPDGINATEPNISIASNYEKIITRSTGAVQHVKITDFDNTGSSQDFKITFDRPANEYGIAAFRIFVLNHEILANKDTLLSLDENYYYEIPSNDTLHYQAIFPSGKKTYGDDGPFSHEYYYACVVTIPDNIAASFDEMTSAGFYVFFSAPLYPETPMVSISDTTKTAHAILVNFPKAVSEDHIANYKIIIVPNENADQFDVADVPELNETNYYNIIPVGEDIATHLPIFQRDYNGTPLNAETQYVIFVAITGLYDNYKSLSYPSTPFTLNDAVISNHNELHFSNNTIFYDFSDTEYHQIKLLNIQGETIAIWTAIGNGTFSLDTEIAQGIYLLQTEKQVIKLFKY